MLAVHLVNTLKMSAALNAGVQAWDTGLCHVWRILYPAIEGLVVKSCAAHVKICSAACSSDLQSCDCKLEQQCKSAT